MPDVIDRVTRNVQRDNARALAAHLNRKPEAQFFIDGVVVCRNCYDPIPAQRLNVNPTAARCIECQQEFEKRG